MLLVVGGATLGVKIPSDHVEDAYQGFIFSIFASWGLRFLFSKCPWSSAHWTARLVFLFSVFMLAREAAKNGWIQ